MSTTTQKLKYLWHAQYEDGHQIHQPADDRYSKHDDSAEHNHSAFRDVLDYQKTSKLQYFWVENPVEEGRTEPYLPVYGVDLVNGRFYTNLVGMESIFELEDAPLKNRKVIFYREMYQQSSLGEEAGEPFVNRYVIGYQGKTPLGGTQKKVIYING